MLLGVQRVVYGDHPSQFAELSLPAGQERVPVVVVIHGGFWRQEYGLELGRPIADDLVAHGVAAWNVEYRRLGGGGGWPQTGHDVLAAVDALIALDHPRLDTGRIVTLGHSAGGHLAVWSAARHDRITGAVAQAGVLDFRSHPQITRRAAELLGGLPDEVPERYADASPAELVPIGVPVICVHGDEDVDVPFEQSESFRGATEVIRIPGAGHMDVITPGTAAWEACRDAALRLLA
jgi:acetyl esterase/lipase